MRVQISSALVFLLALSCLCLARGDEINKQDQKEISFEGLKLSLYDTDGTLLSSEQGKFPSAILANPQLLPSQRIEVRCSVSLGDESFRPQQLQLVAESRASGLAAFALPSKRDAARNGPVSLSIDAPLIKKLTGEETGMFELYLLAGDAAAARGLRWDLGAFELASPSSSPSSSSSSSSSSVAPSAGAPSAAGEPLVKAAATQRLSLSAKPEIRHIFRSPDRRPPAAVSLLFTALAFAPLAGVLVFVFGVLRVNFKGFPTAPAPRLAALAFQVSLLLMVAVLAAFWTKLNLLQTLPLAAAAGAAIFVSGYFSLSHLASQREKRD